MCVEEENAHRLPIDDREEDGRAGIGDLMERFIEVDVLNEVAEHRDGVVVDVHERLHRRSRAGGVVTLSADALDDPQAFARFQQAQGALSSALQRLLSVSENYPKLRANENFLALQDQLEGTENRIYVERRRFNETVREYNTYIRQFPRVIIAKTAGFTEKQYFSADDEAARAPAVSFE